MSEKATTDWLQAWTDVQRKSWESWSNAAQQAMSANNAPLDPLKFWQDNLTRLWSAAGNASQAATDSAKRMADQAASFNGFTGDFFRAFQTIQAAQQAGGDWLSLLNGALDQLKRGFSAATSGGPFDAANSYMALWALPLDNLRRVASFSSPAPGEMLHVFKEEDVRQITDAVRGRMERFLSIPALGYTREWQEQAQNGARYMMDYQHVMSRYTALLNKVGMRSIDLLRDKLVALGQEGKTIDTLRGLYDLWVDCSEDAYAEFAFSEDYRNINAELVDALMRVKHHGQVMAEEMLGALNMPSRRELDTAHARIQDLKRQVMALKQQLKNSQPKDMAAQLEALRKEVEALKQTRSQGDGEKDKSRAEDSGVNAGRAELSVAVTPKPRARKPVKGA